MKNWQQDWQVNCDNFKRFCLNETKKFQQQLKKPMETQLQVLNDIVNITKNSKFGLAHSVSKIHDAQTLRKYVPIRTYEQLFPWIKLETEFKQGVLTTSQLVRWLKTSGSSGESKKIPYNLHWMANYRVPALGVLWGNYLKYCPQMLDNPFAVLDTQTVREPINDFINGIAYQGITNRNPIINENDWYPPWYEAPWFVDTVPEGYENRMYYRLRFLLGQDVKAIFAINPSTMIALEHHLKDRLPELLHDIEMGTLNNEVIAEPDPLLAEKIKTITAKVDFSFKDIWPNLSLIACWTSSSAELYLPQLNRIYPGVKILPFMTCGTEGVVTLPIDDNRITGPLAINQGFYEFLPAEIELETCLENKSPVKTLLFNELELGREYHLIMTQANGLYRMAIGDIFKVTDFYQGVPRIEFSRRQGTYFSFTGEKLTEPQILEAIQSVTEAFSLAGSLFMCSPVWGEPPFYKVLIEIDNNRCHHAFCEALAEALDMKLGQINEEYLSKRNSNRLNRLQVQAINPGTINKYNELQKRQFNAVQYKYKPFQKDNRIFDELSVLSDAC